MHLVHDFKRFTGESPSRFVARLNLAPEFPYSFRDRGPPPPRVILPEGVASLLSDHACGCVSSLAMKKKSSSSVCASSSPAGCWRRRRDHSRASRGRDTPSPLEAARHSTRTSSSRTPTEVTRAHWRPIERSTITLSQFSPDGRWVVFTSHRSGPAEIYRVRPDKYGLEKITADRGFADQATISPDGKSMAYVCTRSGQADILVFDLSTRKVRERHYRITPPASSGLRGHRTANGSLSHPIAIRRRSRAQHTVVSAYPLVRVQFTGIYIVHPDGSGLLRVSDVYFGGHASLVER